MEEYGGGRGDGKLNVAVFPWLAFGHMIPYLELSKRLAARGHDVTFLATPRNVARMPPVPANLSSRLRYVPLPLTPVDGLPEGAESTADVPPGNDELIKTACDGLAAPFAAFLSAAVACGRKPDWIVIDFTYHWLPSIAGEHNVPCAGFFIVQAAMIAFLGPRWANAGETRTVTDLTTPPAWCHSFPPTMAFRRSEARWVVGALQPNASGISDMERMWLTIEACRFTIHRSSDEIEPGVLPLLTSLHRKPAVASGVLLPPPPPPKKPNLAAVTDTIRWLDAQPPKSVIYVALGSEAPVTASNLHELALGLELAGVRFLWALRAHGEILLPEGFVERTRRRGVVWTGWVPQVEVLAHGAVVASLTHCGWGTTIESLAFGHPLVMLPFVVDQGLIARAMAARGVGVEVAREEEEDGGGGFGRDAVAAAVRSVMVEDEGKVFGENARRVMEAVRDQRRQEQYIDELVELFNRGGEMIDGEITVNDGSFGD
uniref:Glycosyltransferase n=1 Tax=Leersia perrieri TaxID=77586 RepID=A0A0D9W0B8_9ORYZ